MPALPCEFGCQCGKHRGVKGSGRKPCPPGCTCSQHTRTREHNARIGISVALTADAKRQQKRAIHHG